MAISRLRAITITLLLMPYGLLQAQTFTVLYAFTSGSDGLRPSAELIRDSSGNLYGTTVAQNGNVFKLSPGGKLTVLYRFTGADDGGFPVGRLVRTPSGELFGITHYGGAYQYGTVFKLDSQSHETVLHTFTGGIDGGWPFAGLLRRLGHLYATAFWGGTNSDGIVFKLDLKDHREKVLYNFTGLDGLGPLSDLISDLSGNFYGTTAYGGTADIGTVFTLARSGKETVVYSFLLNGKDGEFPLAGVIRDGFGNLYGTTSQGGGTGCGGGGCGTVFKLNKNGNETVLHAFTGSDGYNPRAGLMLDADGNVYGTTYFGGNLKCQPPQGCGVIFRVSPNGHEKLLHVFRGRLDGANPAAGLICDREGNLYGVASQGGRFGGGTVFKLKP